MITEYRRLIENVAFFSELSSDELDALTEFVTLRKCNAREVVIWQGDPDDGAYIIVMGYYKVVLTGLDGGEITLGIMGPGEVFGEIALLDEGKRSATVISLQEGRLLKLSRSDFFHFLNKSPKTSMKILQTLAARLRRLTNRAEDEAFLSVSGRLAKKVIELAEQYGERAENNEIRVRIRFSQRELGEMVGATRESVNKNLKNWEALGYVRQSKGHLIVINMDILRELAAGITIAGKEERFHARP